MRVVLQPCSSSASKVNYYKTIEGEKVTIESIKSYISNDDYKILKEMYPNGKCMIWGVKKFNNGKLSSNYEKWKKINRGDVALFSGNKIIFLATTITHKIENFSLANHLWGSDDKSETWELIYFLDESQEINVSYQDFNRIVHYSDNYIIQGFSVLTEEQSTKLIYKYELDSSRYYSDQITENEYQNLVITENIEIIKNNSTNLDIEVQSTKRVEQSFLRNYLFKHKYTHKCSICGRELPVDFLWCSHIKKRSICTNEEKLDYKNIVTPMCKLGCDDLYEKGYIGVKDGKIVILKKSNNNFIDTYLNEIEGNECIGYNDNNKKYYDSHLKYHSKRLP